MSVRSPRLIVAAAAAFAVGACGFGVGSARADDALPPYAQPTAGGVETIGGIVLAYDGRFAVTLQDDRGFDDTVRLRNGTQIDPEGVRLHRGERVVIHGHADGDVFAADEIALDDSGGPTGSEAQFSDDESYQYSAGSVDNGDGGYGGAYFGGGIYLGGGGYSGGVYGYGNGSNGQHPNANGQPLRRPVRPYPYSGNGGATVRHTLSSGTSGGGARSAPASHASGSSHR